MDNLRLVNATAIAQKRYFYLESDQAAGRRGFFLETLGAASAKEVATDMGDILAFSEADRLETEPLWPSEAAGIPEEA